MLTPKELQVCCYIKNVLEKSNSEYTGLIRAIKKENTVSVCYVYPFISFSVEDDTILIQLNKNEESKWSINQATIVRDNVCYYSAKEVYELTDIEGLIHERFEDRETKNKFNPVLRINKNRQEAILADQIDIDKELTEYIASVQTRTDEHTQIERVIGKAKSLLGKRSTEAMAAVIALVVTFSLFKDRKAPQLVSAQCSASYSQPISIEQVVSAKDNRDESPVVLFVQDNSGKYIVSEDGKEIFVSDIGPCEVLVSATDAASNEVKEYITVDVYDDIAPVFDNKETAIVVSPFLNNELDKLVVATDDIDETIAISFSDGLKSSEYKISQDNKSVEFLSLGEYTLSVTAKDKSGNTATKEYCFSVEDHEKPELTLSVDSIVLTESDVAPDYKNMASAIDNVDGDISALTSINDESVDYGTPGKYYVTFSVEDSSGNIANKKLSVKINDTIAPVLKLSSTYISYTLGDSKPDYSENCSSEDSFDGDLSKKVRVDDSQVDYDTPGTYKVIYSVKDKAGNETSKEGYVTVKNQPVTRSAYSGYTVYITDTGGKYHRGNCRYLKNSKHAIDEEEAIRLGYEPCKVCKP